MTVRHKASMETGRHKASMGTVRHKASIGTPTETDRQPRQVDVVHGCSDSSPESFGTMTSYNTKDTSEKKEKPSNQPSY